MNQLGQDLDPRYVPTKFHRNRRRIAPGRALTGLAGQIINQLVKHSFNELRLPWTNSSEILPPGMSLPSLTTIGEDLHPGER